MSQIKRSKRASPARFYLSKTTRGSMKTNIETPAFGLAPGQTLLVINAHPDDLEMFHSSGIEAAQEQKINVVTAIATRGEATTLNYETARRPDTPIEVIRKQETERALDAQNIRQENREYFGLPDGQLHRPFQRLKLTWHIARTILKHNVSAVLMPDDKGIDGHKDHVAVHKSTLLAVTALRLLNKHVSVWANATGDAYDYAVDVNAAHKQELVQTHASQFPKHKPELFKYYAEKGLLKQERYAHIR